MYVCALFPGAFRVVAKTYLSLSSGVRAAISAGMILSKIPYSLLLLQHRYFNGGGASQSKDQELHNANPLHPLHSKRLHVH